MRYCPSCRSVIASGTWSCPRCKWFAEIRNGIPVLAPHAEREDDGFSPEQFKTLFELEPENFWFRARNVLILWALNRYFPSARRILEIGCGTGYVLSAIGAARPGATVVGSELFAEGAVFAARRVKNGEIIQMDARDMPFEEEFDVLGAFDVIEQIEDDKRVLLEAHRALRAAGGLIVTVPQHPSLWSAADQFAFHKRRYTRAELLTKVREAGFRVLCCTSFVTLLHPLMLLSRIRQRSEEKFDPLAEFRIHRASNWIFEKIMAAERLFIRAGMRLPFGGSLLLVAVKI